MKKTKGAAQHAGNTTVKVVKPAGLGGLYVLYRNRPVIIFGSSVSSTFATAVLHAGANTRGNCINIGWNAVIMAPSSSGSPSDGRRNAADSPVWTKGT